MLQWVSDKRQEKKESLLWTSFSPFSPNVLSITSFDHREKSGHAVSVCLKHYLRPKKKKRQK